MGLAEATSRAARLLKESLLGDKEVRFTLEPFVFLLWCGHTIVYGSGIGVDLLILKVCHYELGFNMTVCKELKRPENDDAEAQVQRMVNDFEMVRDWVYNAPPIFFSLIAGALSDRFGRKPLLVFPVIGFFLRTLSSIFIYTFLKELPLEIFMLEEIDCFFGGLGVFFLGMYGFGSTITSDSDRARTLVRYDGVQTLSQIIGTALSPLVFAWAGFYGSYITRAVLTLAALLYLLFVIKEPLKVEEEAKEENKEENEKVDLVAKQPLKRTPLWKKPVHLLRRVWHYFNDYILRSAMETIRTVFRARKNHLRTLIFVQILVYALYKFCSANFSLTYLYMKRMFEAEKHHYALLRGPLKGLQCFCLLVVTPTLLRLGVHEAIVCGLTTGISAAALYLSAAAQTVWQFVAARWGLAFRNSQYGPGRALLTRSCEPDEVTKVLAANSLVAFAIPYAALPAMRKLYNAYIDSDTPFAYILLAASAMAGASVLNFGLYTQKEKFRSVDKKEDEEESKESEEDKDTALA